MPKVGLASLLLAAACATMAPEAEKIRITRNPQATAGCKFLGNVTAGNWGESHVNRVLKEDASKLGGDTVFIAVRHGGVTTIGEVYLCEQPKPGEERGK